MLEFHPYFSGSSGNLYVVSDGEARLAIECGVRYSEIQKALNYEVTSLQGCLISHCHGDHSRATVNMVGAGVDCFASGETWDALGFVRGPINRPPCVKLVDRCALRVGDFDVLPFEVPHDTPGTMGFLMVGPSDESMVYLTDAAYSPFLFEKIKILAVECNWSEDLLRESARSGAVHHARFRRTVGTHMSLERLIDMLKLNDLSQCEEIFLMHLSAQNSDPDEFKSKVQRATGIPTTVCKDRWDR